MKPVLAPAYCESLLCKSHRSYLHSPGVTTWRRTRWRLHTDTVSLVAVADKAFIGDSLEQRWPRFSLSKIVPRGGGVQVDATAVGHWAAKHARQRLRPTRVEVLGCLYDAHILSALRLLPPGKATMRCDGDSLSFDGGTWLFAVMRIESGEPVAVYRTKAVSR